MGFPKIPWFSRLLSDYRIYSIQIRVWGSISSLRLRSHCVNADASATHAKNHQNGWVGMMYSPWILHSIKKLQAFSFTGIGNGYIFLGRESGKSSLSRLLRIHVEEMHRLWLQNKPQESEVTESGRAMLPSWWMGSNALSYSHHYHHIIS